MKSVNKVILVGHLAADPEMRYTSNGTAVAHFRMATNESFSNKEGNKEDRTEWHRVVAWGKLAEICGEYLGKGRQVFIEGKLRTSTWETKEGEKRYTTEIHASDVVFLGSGTGKGAGLETQAGKGATAHPVADEAPSYGATSTPSAPLDEDVPF